MLKLRIATAAIGIPVALFLLIQGGPLFFTAVIILSLIAWHEFCGLMAAAHVKILRFAGAVLVVILSLCAWIGQPLELLLFYSLAGPTLFLLWLWIYQGTPERLPEVAYSWFGIAYIGLLFAHFILLRRVDAMLPYFWLALIGTWASDSGAYFVGCRFGRHFLAKNISPAKTVEGALGGVAFCLLAVLLGGIYFFHLSMPDLFGLGMLIALAAPVGDLAESALKRFAGIKDSGRLFPGHGGVLDRFDSLLFVVPSVYYYVYLTWMWQRISI